ncbi:MAG TPA: ribosome maturation factor RimM [Bacteroidales bacterium]|nr:ribosome maturation factor RimM [Bacteroidales bacterium]
MPVNDTELIPLGKIAKVHGYSGAVILKPGDDFSDELQEMEWIFIETDGKPVPFFVSSIKTHSSGNIILKFDGYDSSEKVREFTGCRVLKKESNMKTDSSLPHQEILTGYKLLKPDNEPVGIVKKVMTLPMQYMLVLENEDGDELLVPLNEEWIMDINKEEKVIIMDLPGGILEVND